MAETFEILTSPGQPFEMTTAEIRGHTQRVYRHALTSLRQIFDNSRQFADRTFIVYEDERITYDEHWKAVTKLGHELITRYGIKKGDKVAIAMRNIPEWSIGFWAAVAIGAVATPLNAWSLSDELEYAISNSESKVVIADGERVDRIVTVLDQLPGVAVIETRGAHGHDRITPLESLIGKPDGYSKLEVEPLPDPGLDTDDDATILYTSGTTGRPKGALGTHRNVLTNLINITFAAARGVIRRGESLPVPDPSVQKASLLPVPFFHVTGCHSMLIPCVNAGNKLVLMHKWNVERALELVEREKVNAMTSVPSMAWQILESPSLKTRDLSSLEGISYGGAAAAPELTIRIREAFPQFWPAQGYGATETSSVCTANGAEDYLNRPKSVGTRTPVNDIRIVGPDGKDVPVGEPGEIWIRGPNVVKGYYRNPEATANAFPDGWYRMGDVGRVDEEGFLYLLDRIKDMLIRGGENIYCVEVEDAIYAYPGVLEAAVIGLPHKVLGEEVGAVIRMRPGHENDDAAIKAHVGRLLAAHKVPVRIEFREEELPRNAAGKILKVQLRNEIAPPTED